MKVLLSFLLFICLSAKAQEQRNYLTKTTSQEQLATMVVPNADWIPFPAYTDRAKWDKVDASLKKMLVEKAVKKLGYSYQFVPASSYLAFATTGDRNVMQRPYGQNYDAVQTFVLGELMEGKGRFLPQIIKGLHNLFEMQTWALSAHLSLQGAGRKAGIIDSSQQIIDLAAGRTGTIVAWTYYFLGDALDKIEPGIKAKIETELDKRIIQPYATRTDFWWMALNTKQRLVNNWNVWCNYNSLTCILLAEKDRKKRTELIYKTMRSVDKFINYYKDDGACEEGPGYWGEAGGNLYRYLDLLQKVSNKRINLFDKPLVRNIATYIYKVYIGNGDYYVNFADAHPKVTSSATLLYNFGKAIQDDTMQSFGSYLAQKQQLPTSDIYETLQYLFEYNEIKSHKAVEPLPLDVDYPQTEIAVGRDKANATSGFYFAAKGGNNNESHNHNDIGSFILYYDAQPLLIDIGSGTYTAKTFSSKRYELFNTRSLNHNVPVINGYEQHEGAQYKATRFDYSASADKVRLTIGIEDAYPKTASVNKWNRIYTLQREKEFSIEDVYDIKENNGKCSANFVTALLPQQVAEGKLRFVVNGKALYLNYDNKNVVCTIVPIDLTDKALISQWGDKLYRIELVFQNKSLSGSNKATITL
ncbi:MAG: heparinase II/III family protein [Chitinophagaceae bacterium]